MHVEWVDSVSGSPKDSGLNFGNISRGQHCMSPQVFHILSDGTDSSSGTMQMFLDDKGWPGAQFRCHVDSTFIPNVQSGSSTIATPLIESPGPPMASTCYGMGQILPTLGWTSRLAPTRPVSVSPKSDLFSAKFKTAGYPRISLKWLPIMKYSGLMKMLR